MGWIESNKAGTKWRGKIRRDGRKIPGPWTDYRHEAEAWWRAEEGAPVVKATEPTRPPTLAEFAADWLARRSAKAAETMRYYRTQVTLGITEDPLGRIALPDLDEHQVERWVVRMDQAGHAARNARVKVLRMVCKSAMRTPWLTTDPTAGITRAHGEIRARAFMADEDVEELLAQAGDDPTFRLLILLAADAGLRWEEMAALAAGSVVSQGQNMTIRVRQSMNRKGQIRNDTKNHRERVVPVVTQRLRKALLAATKAARLRGEGDGRGALLLVAPGPRRGKIIQRASGKAQASYVGADGRRVHQECADRAAAEAWLAERVPPTLEPLRYEHWTRTKLKPAYRAAGIYPEPQGWHDLRHTFGSTLAEQGMPTKMIADLMGHTHTEITELYLHTSSQAVLSSALGEALAGR